MKASELRLGNYVDLFGKVAYITKSDFSETDYGIAIESGKPIPLTEEWLLRFGFNWLDQVDGYRKEHIEHTISMDLLPIENSKEFAVEWDYNWLNSIKHVHQLQNLYFALTGDELKLNP